MRLFIQQVLHLVWVVKLVRIFLLFDVVNMRISFVGHALAKAGGQELRDALSQAAKSKSLTSVGDGKIQFAIFHFFIISSLVVITDAPNLSASHLIHVNSPSWNAGSQEECIGALDKATINILTLADQEGLTSVALPSVSSGKYVENN